MLLSIHVWGNRGESREPTGSLLKSSLPPSTSSSRDSTRSALSWSPCFECIPQLFLGFYSRARGLLPSKLEGISEDARDYAASPSFLNIAFRKGEELRLRDTLTALESSLFVPGCGGFEMLVWTIQNRYV